MSRILSKNAALLHEKAREQGGLKRHYKAKEWCVEVLARRNRDPITEEEGAAANWASRHYLRHEGLLGGSWERVDSGNSQESKLATQIDTAWYGIERAVANRVPGRQTIPALIAICERESLSGVAHQCRFLREVRGEIRTDERTAEALIRLILTALADYHALTELDGPGKSAQEIAIVSVLRPDGPA